MQDSCPRTPAATLGSSRVTLRCPPSPVIRAKEGFFQILREKKREFDSRLDYEFLWLRELKEEVDCSISLGKPLQPSLPTTSTATRKRQRIVLEAREAARAPRAPTPSIFPPTFASTLPPSASSSPSPRVISIASGSSSRLAGAPTMTRGRRGGSIIKSLFTDAAAKAATNNKGKEKDVDDVDDFASDKEVQLADDTSSTTLHDETVPSPLAAKKPSSVAATPSPSGGAAARLGGRASPSLFEPPRNAWLRTPSPMQTMDGKDVIALRVRKKPLPLAQQNLKKRARELGMSPLATSSPSSSAAATPSSSSPAAATKEAGSPCQELLVTEDDEPIVFHMDLSDEVSPGVTAAFDVDALREELERSRHEEMAGGDDGGDEEERRTQTSAILAEEQVVMVGERRTQLVDEPEQLPMKPNRALTPSAQALGSFPTRSGSWFTLGSGLSEAETVLPAPGAKLSEVNLGSNHESDVERRSFVRVSMEIVRSALQELNDEQNGKDDDDVEEEEEQKVTAPPSPSRGGQETAAKKSSSGDKANTSPTSGRRSRIIEREERLRQIDLEREKIKRRRMERQSRRRESDLGAVARANPDNAADVSASASASTSTTSTTAQLSSELRQSAPVSIGERRRNRVTTPPSSPRREVLADITSTSTTRPSSPPPSATSTSTSTTASPRRKKGSPIVPRLDIAKTREAAAKAPGPNSPTSPSLLRNSSRVPPAAGGAVATAAEIRRQLRERSSRRVVTVPQPSTLSLSIRERLQHDALHRARTTAAASRQPSPPAAPTPTPATAAQDKAQPRRRREPSPVVVKKPATAAKEMEKKQKDKGDEKKKPVPADAGGGGNAPAAAAAAGCETVLAYSSLKERKIVDAFLEVIAKEKREREEREQAEKKGRGCVLPYPIPAPGSPSSSFIIMPSPPKRKSLSPGDEATPASASTSTTSSSGSPPKKRKLENGESASSVDDSSSSKENVASALNSPHGKPALQRSTSKETWRGEGEGTLRARQHREREDVHRLYGLDAELARKSAEKLKPDTVREAIVWVYKAARGTTKGSVLMPSSSRGVAGLFDCLKSGRLLCEVANKVRPGIIPKIHIRPIPLMEQENIKMYLAACERMGMRKADLFVASDLYEEKYLPAVLQNIICLSRLASASSSFAGPHLRM